MVQESRDEAAVERVVVVADGNHVAADTGVAVHRLTRSELDRRGEAIGRRLVAPAIVTLTGDLGAGKTTLVQAICRGLQVTAPVTSPTFALIHEYAAPHARVVHCDLYRLDSVRDVHSLGLDDIVADSRTIVLIEWPERAAGLLPAPTLTLSLSHVATDEHVRELDERWAK
jgi:tRNA threonylcarbamoyladenosine biosynthesis protein TsaE